MATPRIYIVSPKVSEGNEPRRLVRAHHRLNALRHVAEDIFGVAVASQDDLVKLVGQGVKVEDITHEQQKLPD